MSSAPGKTISRNVRSVRKSTFLILFMLKSVFNKTIIVERYFSHTLWHILFSLLQGILLYCNYQASTFDMRKLPKHHFEAMDNFAKCFLILRLESSQVEGGLHCADGDIRGWRAVRVDLVSPPVDRYAFALLGWTGSKVRRIVGTG